MWPKQRCLVLATVALLLACSRAQETVNVRLVFQGLSQSEFEKVAPKIADSIASVAGVPADYVTRVGGESSSNTAQSSSSNGPSLIVDSASSRVGTEVPESAPSQLPSGIATAPGYIRAQYSSGGSSSSTIGSSISAAVPKTVSQPGSTTPRQHRTSKHGSNSNSTGGSSSSSTGPAMALASTPVVPASIVASRLDRKLLAADSTTVEYLIRSNASAGPWAEAAVIRRKFLSSAAGFGQASSAGFGKGFYATLEKNGVPYQPIVYLEGVRILAGGLDADAPKSRFGQRHEDDPKVFDPNDLSGNHVGGVIELRDVRPVSIPVEPAAQQHFMEPWLIGVIVAAAVLALALGGLFVWKCCTCCCGRDKTPDDASQGSSQNQFITDDSSAVTSAQV